MSTSFQKEDFFQEYAVAISPNLEKVRIEHERRFYPHIKRFLDILFGFIGIVCSVPFILVFGLLIKLETPGPIFYKQERVGINGKYFMLIKLRSMVKNAEENGAKWAEKNDSRVTKVGEFMRKTRIDELPQFWNVLVGDMSLIGPRPERPMFTAQFNEEIPGFIERLRVRPGITGWAQVNGGYDISPIQKLELDKYYIKNMSFYLDIKIILKTIKVVMTGDGAR